MESNFMVQIDNKYNFLFIYFYFFSENNWWTHGSANRTLNDNEEEIKLIYMIISSNFLFV